MIKVIVGCFGGDNSPKANVEGACIALDRNPDLSVVLTGDEELIRKELDGLIYDKSRLEIVHAPEVIGCDEKPTDAIRFKKESSLMKAITMLRTDEDGQYAGMVSTGSTGALVAAATLRLGRIPGVIRPAFCPVLPTMAGGVVGICDSGANIDITPDYLRQFAVMGSLYLEKVCGVKNPRVGLLNIGTEEEKGDALRKEAYGLLKETKCINFVGNMEGRDLLGGEFDLCVCDGFSGNVLIKSVEGTALGLLKKIKTDIKSSFVNKIGALFMYKMFMREKEFMDYRNYGGSVLLGTQKIVVKGHGSGNAETLAKCIEKVYLTQVGDLANLTEKALASLNDPAD